MSTHTDNIFDYFDFSLKEIFKIDQKKIERLAHIYNESTCTIPIKKVIETTKHDFDSKLIDSHIFALAAVVREYALNKKDTQRMLRNSNLKPQTKKIVQIFFSKLNENGLHVLQIQYHVMGNMLEFTTLEDTTENKELIEIQDTNGDSVCYLPAVRLKFTFSDEQKISAVFSQHDLSQFISTLQEIYDKNSKSVTRYKDAIKDLPVVE